ncbi:LysR family substrate-binding domain-containing protein [Microbacterium sp. Clip185]|uniref:LysR family substrate-binding domain-containing protein n=1 Tax=Microbacterium sp. Clip185 TaxID=3025663 RepID=UPI002365F801|nr:LysR family substrate-binding domain-containing protein [Microbacterium sp. Clip185]WDG17702.1 LysR family substrate-binding domain-containing protein [Microbacterium sp. Clip185]
MAGRGAPKGGKKPARSASTRSGGSHRPARSGSSRAPAKKPEPAPAPPIPEGPFRLGAIPGATPGKWIDIWQERMPSTTLELVPLEVAAQEEALQSGRVDAALVRPPVDTERWHLIRLYEETIVVAFSADSHLAAGDELTPEDLEGEVLVVPADDVLDPHIASTLAPAFAAPRTTADAIEIVASGVGIVIVPMSLARLHHRKDVEYRALSGAAPAPVGFAWPREDASPLVDTFIGILRGRTAQSSRD